MKLCTIFEERKQQVHHSSEGKFNQLSIAFKTNISIAIKTKTSKHMITAVLVVNQYGANSHRISDKMANHGQSPQNDGVHSWTDEC